VTQPTPEKKLRARQVVTFVRVDPVLGTTYEGVGVVRSVEGDQVTIRPLQLDDVTVELDNVEPITAATEDAS
jgi:hypothetical protein